MINTLLAGKGYSVRRKHKSKNKMSKETETAEVVAVRDWNDWCWDVCISYNPTFDTEWHSSCQAIQFPRDRKPEIGDVIEFVEDQMVIHEGREVAIDIRVIRMDEEGNIFLD